MGTEIPLNEHRLKLRNRQSVGLKEGKLSRDEVVPTGSPGALRGKTSARATAAAPPAASEPAADARARSRHGPEIGVQKHQRPGLR